MSSNLGGLFALCDAATSIEVACIDGDVHGGINERSFSNDGCERSFVPNEKKRPWNNDNDNNNNSEKSRKSRKSESMKRKRVDDHPTFPVILMAILTHPSNEEVIAFLSDNQCFVIVDPQRLEREVLPLYFDESVGRCEKTYKVDRTRYSHLPNLYQFRALLAMWGFGTVRDLSYPDVELHGHSSFKRGDWEACIRMKPKPSRSDAGTESEKTSRSFTSSFNSNGITKQQNTLEEAVRVPKARSVTPTDGSNGIGNGSSSCLLSSLHLVSPEHRRQHCSQQQAYHRRIFRENQLHWLRPDLGRQHWQFRRKLLENSAQAPLKKLPLFRRHPSPLPSLSTSLTPPPSRPMHVVSDAEVETATASVVSAAIKALRWKRSVTKPKASNTFMAPGKLHAMG